MTISEGPGISLLVGGIGSNVPGGTAPDLLYVGAGGVLAQLANGTAGQLLQANGGTTAPSWATISTGLTVGTTTITSGTTTRILYDNAGVLGEYTVSGTGTTVPLTAGPTFTNTIAGASLSLSSLTSGGIPIIGTAGLLSYDANILWDATNKRQTIASSTGSIQLGATGYNGSGTAAIYGGASTPIWAIGTISGSMLIQAGAHLYLGPYAAPAAPVDFNLTSGALALTFSQASVISSSGGGTLTLSTTAGAGPSITAGTAASNAPRALSISQGWTAATSSNIGIVSNTTIGAGATGKLLSLQAGAGGVTEVFSVSETGTVTGGGATPFVATLSGASLGLSLTNSLNSGYTQSTFTNNSSLTTQLGISGSTAATFDTIAAGSSWLYSDSSVALAIAAHAAVPTRFINQTKEQWRILSDGTATNYGTLVGTNGAGAIIGTSANNLTLAPASAITAVTGALTVSTTGRLGSYTVATLPAGADGDIARISDQLTAVAAKGVAPTGGGSVHCYVEYNGSVWVGI